MRNRFGKLGFTLIELLIVITIIGILAVVFLPSILDAPAKSRDAARKADVGNIVEAIEALRLDGKTVVPTTGDIKTSGCVSTANEVKNYAEYFGGSTISVDPSKLGPSDGACDANYHIQIHPVSNKNTYSVIARVERKESANMNCKDANVDTEPWATAISDTATEWCYGIRQN